VDKSSAHCEKSFPKNVLFIDDKVFAAEWNELIMGVDRFKILTPFLP
jgi:hypothetical protein